MSRAELSRQEMIDMLVWQQSAGIDTALVEEPENWLDRPGQRASAPPPQVSVRQSNPSAPSPSAPPARSRSDPQPVARAPIVAEPEGALVEARQLARAANDLEALQQALTGFNGCTLKQSANQLVFADGNPQADIMLIGEAPGRDEDIAGLPFVGRSGQLLDRILAAIGLDRTCVYIANTVPWRPPGNRTPSPMETQICRPFIERQVELVAPKIVVTLGGAASKQILDVSTGILRLRGQVREITLGQHTVQCLATLHPAYLLRQPAQKKLVWQDMLTLKAMMESA